MVENISKHRRNLRNLFWTRTVRTRTNRKEFQSWSGSSKEPDDDEGRYKVILEDKMDVVALVEYVLDNRTMYKSLEKKLKHTVLEAQYENTEKPALL